jgi:AcrR family transcriptional regulator
MPKAESAVLGVREQRKLDTRLRLIRAAKKGFEERGYNDVTVAEIAAAAGVSAKTLFQHFRSKEELLLAQLEEIHDYMVRSFRERDPGTAPLDGVVEWLFDWMSREPADARDRFRRMVGTGPAVESMRRRLYEEWENALVAVLAEEANEAQPTPRTRLVAAQLIAMIRVLSSPEMYDWLDRYRVEDREEAFASWVREAAAMLENGIGVSASD